MTEVSDLPQHSYIFFLPTAQQPPGGERLKIHTSRSHSDTSHSEGLLWTSDQPIAETSTWQHTKEQRDIYYPGWIRTRKPRKRAAADPLLRPRGHQHHLYIYTYLLTYLLTPCSAVLLEKLTCLQLVKKFLAFYGTRKFITAFTSARQLSLSWASSIQSIPPHPTSWTYILTLSVPN
jgi:hypothetical protein